MEADDEVKGSGNSYDFGARMYDSRLGSFLSLDPKARDFAFMSPYCYAANSSIYFTDENGEGPNPPKPKFPYGKYLTVQIAESVIGMYNGFVL